MTELIHLWQAGDGVARFVSLLLLAMSVCSWVLIFWRGWTLARARADSVYAALRAGASFDSLARAHADPSEPKLAEDVAVAQLPPEYQAALGDSARGLLPPFMIGEGSPRPKVVVLDVTARRAGGPLRYEDVRDRIRQNLGQQLAIQHFLGQLRRTTYVDIRL